MGFMKEPTKDWQFRVGFSSNFLELQLCVNICSFVIWELPVKAPMHSTLTRWFFLWKGENCPNTGHYGCIREIKQEKGKNLGHKVGIFCNFEVTLHMDYCIFMLANQLIYFCHSCMSFTFSNLLQANPIKFAMKSSELSWDENHQMKISWLVVLASCPIVL